MPDPRAETARIQNDAGSISTATTTTIIASTGGEIAIKRLIISANAKTDVTMRWSNSVVQRRFQMHFAEDGGAVLDISNWKAPAAGDSLQLVTTTNDRVDWLAIWTEF